MHQEGARFWRLRAEVLFAERRLEGAAASLQRAVELARRTEDYEEEGVAERLLAHVYDAEGYGEDRRALVRRHLERSETALRRAGNTDDLLDVLAFTALRAAEAGDDANAQYALSKAAAIDATVADWWRSYMAFLTSDAGTAAAALRHCLETIDTLPAAQREPMRRECELKLALVAGNDPGPLIQETMRDRLVAALRPAALADGSAEEEFVKAVEEAERARSEIRSEVRQRELSATFDLFYRSAAALADRGGRYRQAVDTLALNMSRSFCSRGAMQLLWRQAPEQSWTILRDTNAALIRALGMLERRGGEGERGGVELALRRRREAAYHVEQELIRLVPGPHQLFLPTGLASLEQRIGGDDAVVVFAPFGCAYVVRGGEVARVATRADDDVVVAASAFRALASTPGRPVPDPELAAAAATLSECFIEPLRPMLVGARRVFVVPSEKLWALPLAALGRTPLAETHAVAYVPSLGILGFLAQGDAPPRRVERFVGVADPDGSLPAARAEVASAAARFYDSVTLVGEEIDFGAVATYLWDADIVHVAAHGGFFPDYPELAFLHIAGRDDERVFLWAQDILRIHLRPRLLVLASCDAGTAVALPGNEYVGLPASFLDAGARTVIAPLWAVDDRSTASLMDAFYAALADAQPAQALWRAQDRLRGDRSTAHPYHWAAFQVFGLPSSA